MKPRGSTLAFVVWCGLTLLIAGAVVGATWQNDSDASARELTARLGLTDIALFNEARYTRNPTMADLHSAFQDGPASLDHFPTGSILSPSPPGLRGKLEVIDP